MVMKKGSRGGCTVERGVVVVMMMVVVVVGGRCGW